MKAAIGLLVWVCVCWPQTCRADVLFSETFDDDKLAERGWYDNTQVTISRSERVAESGGALEFRFARGAKTPASGGAIRRKFSPTETVYLSYSVKYSANWEGSNRSYHPHEFYLLTNADRDYTGPAYTHLTVYIEQNEGYPLLATQDARNIDTRNIGVDLVAVTENRAVSGCNGAGDGYGPGNCYAYGGVHRNEKKHRAAAVYFGDKPGATYKNDWHRVECFVRLNRIAGGRGVADGVLKYWYDGRLVIDRPRVLLRTARHPGMKFNQLLIGPYIGRGSPVDQTFWIDDLSVGTQRIR